LQLFENLRDWGHTLIHIVVILRWKDGPA